MPKGLNVIVICNDTLRADVVDHSWEDQVALPNLDRFRQESFAFSQAYGDGYPTVPMRRGFYTGRRTFPYVHDIDDTGSAPNTLGWHAIPPQHTTLAETLCSQGVMTGLVTDLYHLFKPTMNFTRGFVSHQFVRGQEGDRLRSGPLNKIDLKPHLHPAEQDLKRHGGLLQYLLNVQDRTREEEYFAAEVFQRAAHWLDDNAGQKPFLLWVDSFTPHEYWDPPKAFADAYYRKEGVVDYTYPQFFESRLGFNEEEVRRTKALYYGYCTFMDKWLGYLFRKIDEQKLWDDTVVVVTSDHGTELRDRDRFGKSAERLHPYNTRLNLYIRHPERSLHGKRSEALVQNIDLAPTICNWMGVAREEPFDGLDLNPLLTGRKDRLRDWVIGGWGKNAFVRDHAFNYVVNTLQPDAKTELYDLRADPSERQNIAPSQPATVQTYRKRLEELLGHSLPARYAHQVRSSKTPGLPQFLLRWEGSNLA